VSFDESISVDEDVYILMKDEDVGLPLRVTTSLLNPYTVSFVAPGLTYNLTQPFIFKAFKWIGMYQGK